MKRVLFGKFKNIATAGAVLSGSISSAAMADFIDDSHLTINTKNYFFNRDFHNRNANGQSYRQEWAQGFITQFKSGYTEGSVGFGIDVLSLVGIKLDSGSGRLGTGLLPYSGAGNPGEDHAQDSYGSLGIVPKIKISNTEFKYGRQLVSLPVLAGNTIRLLPETGTGLLITSREISGLELNIADFTKFGAMNEANADAQRLPSARAIGGSWTGFKSSKLSYYYSDVKDYYTKHYVGANHVFTPAKNQRLTLDFNMYDTKSQGEARAGALSNRAFSLAGTWAVGAHSLMLTYQGVSGTGTYAYGVEGGGSIYLANSSYISDFNYEHEKSMQASYNLDMAAFGAPGLSFTASYVKGVDFTIDGEDDQHEYERSLQVKYVVQSGPAKNLSIRLPWVKYRNSFQGNTDDVRVVVEYPIEIF